MKIEEEEEEGVKFYEKYMSILCINEIFAICPSKFQNELMRSDKTASTNLNFIRGLKK